MGEQLCYQFQLNNFSLNITETTIRVLNNFILKSGFHRLPLKGVGRVFNDSAKDGLITKSQFDSSILKILSLTDISEVDKVGCSMTLSSVFYAFDRTDSNVVDVVDLMCGIAVLCDGSKSVKLAFAFELMDEDGDGLLSKRGLWRYFRAFLCTLLTISGASLEMGSDELTAICDDSAVWTCSQLLSSLQSKGNASSDVVRGCSFEDLADWYTHGGYVVATWLELLDLSKWLPLRPLEEPTRPKSAKNSQFKADALQSARPSSPSPLPENPFVEEDGPEIFRSDLAGGQTLSLKESDSNFVLEVAQLTGFYNMSPPLLIGRLVQHARDNGTITIANYNSFVSNTVPDELRDDELARVSFALSSIYYSYDDDGENEASVTSLASGLCVLCTGSKSAKLSSSFHLFDSDDDGYLSPNELEQFLGSFLRMLLACSFSTASTRAYGVTSSIVNSTCQFLAKSISRGQYVDFQCFGDWYNEGGFKVIPWIELIDLSKWVKITANTTEAPPSAIVPGRSPTLDRRLYSNVVSDTNDMDENQAAFTLMLYRRNAKHIVSISADTVRSVRNLSTASGLANIEPEQISQAVLSVCSRDMLLSRKEFDRLIQRINPERRKQYYANVMARVSRGEPPSSPFSEKSSDAFGALFNSFDRTGKGVVDAVEVAIGLAILCSGSKSAKLAAAFDLLDENASGVLSRRCLWKFFRSFLCSLLTLSGAAQELSSDEITRVADGTALFACDSVLTSPTTSEKDDMFAASFDDIADWYTSAGYRVAPWLELLDMTKWKQLVTSSAE